MHPIKALKLSVILLVFFMTISSSNSQTISHESHRRMVLGGFSPVDTTDPQVVTAGELVVHNLTHGKGPTDKYSFLLTSDSDDSRRFEMKVLEASQQVSKNEKN